MSRTNQKTPANYKVTPWQTPTLSSEQMQSISSCFKAIGNNIILNGMEPSISFNGSTIYLSISQGTAIQDSSLLELHSEETLSLDLNSFQPSGILVLYLFFSIPDNDFKVGLTYIDNSENDEWDESKCLTILNVYNFTKNNSTISSVTQIQNNYINIHGNLYYKKGLTWDNIYLSNIMSLYEKTTHYVNSDYEAIGNETVICDTSNGQFTFFLPNNPPIGTKVVVIDGAGTFWDNSLRIDANGSVINGSSDNLFFRFQYSITNFYYTGSQNGWVYNLTRMWTVSGGTF